MSLNAKKVKSENNRERPPALEPGTYPARLVQVISFGLQPQRPYMGEDKPPKIDLHMTYELADEFLKDEDGNDLEDKPRWVSETLPLNNLNSDMAKSTKRYYALDQSGEHDGDFGALISTPCMLTLSADASKSDKNTIYNNIQSVQAMRTKDAAKAPELVNDPKIFDFYEPDMDVFNSLPNWIQDKCKEALDFNGSELEAKLGKPKAEPKEEKKEEESSDDDW